MYRLPSASCFRFGFGALVDGLDGFGTMTFSCSVCSTRNTSLSSMKSRKKPDTVTVSLPSGVWLVSENSTFWMMPISGRKGV